MAMTDTWLTDLVAMTLLEDGPIRAVAHLRAIGISLVVERHLPSTLLDGAALGTPEGYAIIGLTLRHDRLDNFWFTLFHELAHVALHLDKGDNDVFLDDITKASKDRREEEADELASEGLIPGDLWKAAKLRRNSPTASVVDFAEKLRISAAIPAGRIRFESDDYTVMKALVSFGKLRPMFGVAG
jgi:HTH-type transcriptional regulator/antitoxin HigA